MTGTTRHAFAWITLSLAAGRVGAQEATPPDPVARFEQIDAGYSATVQAYRKAVADAAPDRRRAISDQHVETTKAYVRRYLDLAREFPKDPIALDALRAVVVVGRGEPEAREAMGQFRRDWLTSPKIASSCYTLGYAETPGAEAFLRDVLAENPDRNARGHASLALANLLSSIAEVATLAAGDRPKARRRAGRMSPEEFEAIVARDPAALNAEADALNLTVLARYADVPWILELPHGLKPRPDLAKFPPTLATQVARNHSERNPPIPGRPAPIVEGVGFDGKSSRLSDFRGKVVVVAFWGSTTNAAREPVARLRALAERLKDRPFALVAVNCDPDEADARAAVAEAKLPGTNWRGGHPVASVPAAWFGVRTLPVLFVIDKAGVIRHAGLSADELDEAVDDLLRGD